MRLDHPSRDLVLLIMRVRPSPADVGPSELADNQALIWEEGDLSTVFTVENTSPPTYTLVICRAGAPHELRSKVLLAGYVAAMGRRPEHSRHRRVGHGTQTIHYWDHHWLGTEIERP